VFFLSIREGPMTIDRKHLHVTFLARQLAWAFGVCFLMAFAGCSSGPPTFIIKGKVVDGAKPLLPDAGTSIQIVFAQQADEGKAAYSYSTRLNADDGTFEMLGNESAGVPAGKYRVALLETTLKPSATAAFLNARFRLDNSPIIVDIVDDKTPLEIDISRYRKK